METMQLSWGDYELKEVSVRLVLNETSSLYSAAPLSTPRDAVNVMGELLRGMDREMVCVVNMDNRLRPINYNVVSIGGIDSSLVPIQNCFKAAILSNAAALIMLHSHPSGSVEPSREDYDVTKRMIAAGNLMNISVIDHVIIGAYQGAQYSFRENHPDFFMRGYDASVIDTLGLTAENREPEIYYNASDHVDLTEGKVSCPPENKKKTYDEEFEM